MSELSSAADFAIRLIAFRPEGRRKVVVPDLEPELAELVPAVEGDDASTVHELARLDPLVEEGGDKADPGGSPSGEAGRD